MKEEQLKELGLSDELLPKVVELHTAEIEKKESELKGEISKAVNTAYGNIDREILTETKIPKLDNEKTSEYWRRAYAQKNQLEITERDNKIAELEAKIKNGSSDETLKQELAALKEEKAKFPEILEQKTSEWQQKYEEKEKELSTYQRNTMLKQAVPTKFKEGLDVDYVQYKIDQAIAGIEKDGYEVRKDDKGNILLVNDSTYDKIKAKDYFKDKLSNLIDTTSFKGGGSGKEDQHTMKDGVKIYPDSMTRLEKFAKIEADMISDGMNKASLDWTPEYNKRIKANGLAK